MYYPFAPKRLSRAYFAKWRLLIFSAMCACVSITAVGQNSPPPLNTNLPFSIRATHLLGFPNTKNNCAGTLSIQDHALRFQKSGNAEAEVSISSVRAYFIGEESRQVGGLPVKLGKAAAPFGTGRVASLFAHKKYDTLTLEYVDRDGAVHGAIFEIVKGQGELVRKELAERSLSFNAGDEEPAKGNTPEGTIEDK